MTAKLLRESFRATPHLLSAFVLGAALGSVSAVVARAEPRPHHTRRPGRGHPADLARARSRTRPPAGNLGPANRHA